MSNTGVAVARVPQVQLVERENKVSWIGMMWAELIARWEGCDEIDEDPLLLIL